MAVQKVLILAALVAAIAVASVGTERVVSQNGPVDRHDEHQAEALLSQGRKYLHQGQFEEAEALLGRAFETYQVAEDATGVAATLVVLAQVYGDRGQGAQARAAAQQALRAYRALGNEAGVAAARVVLEIG